MGGDMAKERSLPGFKIPAVNPIAFGGYLLSHVRLRHPPSRKPYIRPSGGYIEETKL
jgi:hypothetical protein